MYLSGGFVRLDKCMLKCTTMLRDSGNSTAACVGTFRNRPGRILKIDPVASMSEPTDEHVQCGATGSTIQKTEVGPYK